MLATAALPLSTAMEPWTMIGGASAAPLPTDNDPQQDGPRGLRFSE
jgi:hypothetical protein